MDAPGGRGALWKVATTVPTPTLSPDSHQRTRSSSTSRIADHLQESLVGRQGVPGHEVVDVREHGAHPGLDRLVPLLAPVRVDPDETVGDAAQLPGLLGQKGDVTALPAVAEDDDDGTPGHPAPAPPAVAEAGADGPPAPPPPAPPVEEHLQRLAQTRAARPVRHDVPRGDQGPLAVAHPQGAGEVGEPGADGEGLDHRPSAGRA